MATIKGCRIPEDYYYDIDRHVWARIETNGSVTMGVTDLAQHLAGRLFYAKIKPPGQVVEQFRGIATIESGQFVGSVPASVGGEIIRVNELLPTNPSLINHDPYEKGWIASIKPSRLESDLGLLLTGPAAVEAYRNKMEREKIGCR